MALRSVSFEQLLLELFRAVEAGGSWTPLFASLTRAMNLEPCTLILRMPSTGDLGELYSYQTDLAFEDVYRTIRRVARSNASVLLLGETGTGKELVATAIHHSHSGWGRSGPVHAAPAGGDRHETHCSRPRSAGSDRHQSVTPGAGNRVQRVCAILGTNAPW